jgi:hypothetical protein
VTVDLIKCLAAAHLPLTKRKKEDADWFERVDKLTAEVKKEIEEARADERAKVLDVVHAYLISAHLTKYISPSNAMREADEDIADILEKLGAK